MFKILLILSLFPALANATGSTRTVVADQIQSSDLTKTWVMPPASGTLITSAAVGSGFWSVGGNIGTGGTGKIGTSDAQPFDIVTNNASRITVGSAGNFATIQNVNPVDGVGFRQWSQQTNLIGTVNTTTASYVHDYRLLSFDTGGFDLTNSVGVGAHALSYGGAGTTQTVFGHDLSANLSGTGTIDGYTGSNLATTVGASQTITNYYGNKNNTSTTGGTINNLTGDTNSLNLTNATSTNVIAKQDQVFIGGTSAITNTVLASAPYIQVNDSAALSNGATGEVVGVDVNNTSVVNGITGSSLSMNIRDTSSAGNINGYSLGMNQQDGATSTGLNGFNANIQYSGTSTGQNANVVNLYARTSDTADLNGLTMIQTNPEIEGSSTVDNYTGAGIYGQIRGNAVTQNVTGLAVNPTISANAVADNFTGATIHAQSSSTVPVTSGILGTRIQVSSTAGEPSVKGLEINMNAATLSPAALAAGSQKIGLDIQDGALNSGYSYTVPGAAGFFQTNYLGGSAIVASGDPTSAFGFGNNFAHTVQFDDDWNLDGSGLGFIDVGFIGSIQGGAGKTMASWTGALGGAGNPSGSGTITNAYMFRSAGILPSGGSLVIDNAYGFAVDTNLSCIVGTNCWGFYNDNAVAENYVNKLAIGTSSKKVANSDTALEIGNSKAFINGRGNTAARNALAPLAGMQFFDTDLNVLQYYNGATWVTASAGASVTEAQEVPAGTIDGVNDTFTLANTPSAAASVKLYKDGLILVQGVDYTLAGLTITIAGAEIPDFGQTLYADYTY